MARRPLSPHPRRPYRGSSAAQGYGPAWRRLRARVLLEEPTCRGYLVACSNPSQEVDHIRPRLLGGTNERDNLQGLCGSCHRRKTSDMNRERRGPGVSESLQHFASL